MILVAMVGKLAQTIMNMMGVPNSTENTEKALAIAECVVSVEMGEKKTKAISKLYRDLGLNGWRNEAMTHATIEAYENVKKSGGDEMAVLLEVERLRTGADFVGLEL